jgi:hypothetical protein
MPYFRIRNGPFSGAADQGTELADDSPAWEELTGICSDLVGSIAGRLKQNAEWQMELLDESKNPVFRIRLVAEQPRKSRESRFLGAAIAAKSSMADEKAGGRFCTKRCGPPHVAARETHQRFFRNFILHPEKTFR